MYRVIPLASLLLAACGAGTPPVATASTAGQLFRGGQSEVRFRCGSEALRARLRQGQLLAQIGDGESAVLVPVDDPRAGSGPAWSDGRLTLYKVRDRDGWALARGTSAAAECTREAPAP